MNQPNQRLSSSAGKARISVAMATYNGEKFLREQLDSLAKQALLPTEVVITDDGSTDGTLQVIENFSRNASFPVRVFRNKTRLGYADNFFKAASLCTGEVIAFCDQDDIWLENKLSTCAPFFADGNVLLVAHTATILTQSGTLGHRRPDYSRTRILNTGSGDPFGFPPGFAMLVRRDLLNAVRLPHRPRWLWGHDQWFWFLAGSIGNIALIADTLALYRQHEANVFGAGLGPTGANRVRSILRGPDYDTMAGMEFDCYKAIVQANGQGDPFAQQLHAAAIKIRRRAEFHRIRSRIYKPNSTILGRTTAFAHILLAGGYLPDESRTRLGINAAMKDLLLGVPGAFKISALNGNAAPN